MARPHHEPSAEGAPGRIAGRGGEGTPSALPAPLPSLRHAGNLMTSHEEERAALLRYLDAARARRLRVLDLLDLDLVADELVHIDDDALLLYIHQDKGRRRLLIQLERGREGAGRRARVDEELPLRLVRCERVRVARDEDVAIELALERGERLRVAPRYHLVAVAQPQLELADLDHLCLREAVGDAGKECRVIKVATHLCAVAEAAPWSIREAGRALWRQRMPLAASAQRW